ncbi:hypothetical protein [Streptomyces sp. NBC_01198]|uniref:hypothetical protein n=1 Tax=Streptomyces sp. NBC_01198 TaxID=2903769 RepID=UPI002E14C50A|nr:hypothetical protein OG702_00370 [Streptomyces sp. NBC_01198]
MDDEPAEGTARPAARSRKESGLRAPRSWIGEFVVESVGEVVVQIVSCLFLIGVGAGFYWAWQRSAALTSGAVVVLFPGAVVVFTQLRHPGPFRVRRVGLTLVTVLVVLVVWFLLYGTNCDCL